MAEKRPENLENQLQAESISAGQDLRRVVRRVLIYANPSKSNTAVCLVQLQTILQDLGIEFLIYNEFQPSRVRMMEHIARGLGLPLPAKSQQYYGEHPEESCSDESFVGSGGQALFELVITVGGDGTVLKYLSYTPFREIPILPINTGSLGYITSISFDSLEDSLLSIFAGAFVYSPRILLKAKFLDREGRPKHYRHHFALNEIAISACRAGLLAEMELQVSNSSIPLQGDGIIVATPTGSTAYSLAAGGPIVDAEMRAFIITPVSPFSLATRPVVTPSNVHLAIRNAAGKLIQTRSATRSAASPAASPATSPAASPAESPAEERRGQAVGGESKTLEELDSSEAPLSVAVDGWPLGRLFPGESIHITRSKESVQFVATSHHSNYFENIRTKLGWHNFHHRSPYYQDDQSD